MQPIRDPFDSSARKDATPVLLHAIYLPEGFVLLCPARRLNRLDVEAIAQVVTRTLIERGALRPDSNASGE